MPAPMPADNAGPTLTVAAVARRIGVAPATLRTWDRRYGLGPSLHSAGSHRRYTGSDLARLEVMRRLTLQGVSPAEAARLALADDASAAPPDSGGHPGGGRVISLPAAEPATRGLARAAMALDAEAASQIVREHLQRHGVVWTWDHLLVPVLVGVGERWKSTGTGIDVEHVLSEVIMATLRTASSQAPAPVHPRPVLLASTDDEQHALPLHALAAGLSDRRVATRVLGPRVPAEALTAAVRRSGPAAVFLWAQLDSSGEVRQLDAVPAMRPAVTVVAGGPGWPEQLPSHVVRVTSLSEALEATSRAALG